MDLAAEGLQGCPREGQRTWLGSFHRPAVEFTKAEMKTLAQSLAESTWQGRDSDWGLY